MGKQFKWFCIDLLMNATLPSRPTLADLPHFTDRDVPCYACILVDNELVYNNDLYRKLDIAPERSLPLGSSCKGKIARFTSADQSAIFGAFLEARFTIAPVDPARAVHPYRASHSSNLPYNVYTPFQDVETRLEGHLFQF